jgi:hypothetical protein
MDYMPSHEYNNTMEIERESVGSQKRDEKRVIWTALFEKRISSAGFLAPQDEDHARYMLSFPLSATKEGI